jgi:type IV pilus assembly protein PilQ
VVIGGIFEQTERSDEAKVPLLGDVPVLGNLFKTKTNSIKKTELLIFLTPRVVSERTAAR